MLVRRLKKNGWVYVLAVLICALHFTPFYVLITMSLKKMSDLSSRWTMPHYLYLENFRNALSDSPLPRAFLCTAIITVLSVFFLILIGGMAAYPLARRRTKGNSLLRRFVMGMMMVPPLTILVPLYSTMVSLGGISTYWGIVTMLVTFNLPLSIYLFSNFIASIPRALDEAASIDGCGHVRIFFQILLPQLKPVITSVIILTGVGCWNDYTFSLYMLQSPKIKSVTLVIANYFTQTNIDLNAAAATALIAVLPMILAFLFLQKYFVQGMVDSAIKE